MLINWKNIEHFTPAEFSEDPDKHADPELIMTLDEYRDLIGCKFWPSRRSGALARFAGTDPDSEHYAVNRKSRAIDGFPECHIRDAWLMAFRCKLWGGVGVYFDTDGNDGKPRPMLHLDLRRTATTEFWFRINGTYGHPMRSAGDMQRMFSLFANC